jgi:hypothetical protein
MERALKRTYDSCTMSAEVMNSNSMWENIEIDIDSHTRATLVTEVFYQTTRFSQIRLQAEGTTDY